MSHVHTVPSRDFARDVGGAKRLASDGPVFITDRGKPAFALLSIEDYYRLTNTRATSLLEVMDGIPGGAFEFDPARVTGEFTPADFG